MIDLFDLFSDTATTYSLEQNSPNPFDGVTNIRFSTARQGHVSLKLYNDRGKETLVLVDEIRLAGKHSVLVDSAILDSGVYYYKLIAGSYSVVKKMELRKTKKDNLKKVIT